MGEKTAKSRGYDSAARQGLKWGDELDEKEENGVDKTSDSKRVHLEEQFRAHGLLSETEIASLMRAHNEGFAKSEGVEDVIVNILTRLSQHISLQPGE